MLKTRAIAAALCVLFFIENACEAQNPIFDLLTKQGVKIDGDDVVRLPVPILSDGMSAAEQRRAIEQIADAGHPWDQLTRKSVVAPFIFKFDTGKSDRQHSARRIDLWFVIYGDFATLCSDQFLDQHFMAVGTASDPENRSSVRLLSETELGRTLSNREMERRYYSLEFSILDRVRLKTTTCNVKTETKDSVLSASILFPKSESGREFPEEWRPITRDDSRRRKIGMPHRYSGFGAYAKATPLVGVPGANFVEYHIVFAEPEAWFSGDHFLDAKMPFLAQYIVRDLRQGLMNARK